MKIQAIWVTCIPTNSSQLLTTHSFPRWKGMKSLLLQHHFHSSIGAGQLTAEHRKQWSSSPAPLGTEQWDACRKETFPLPHHLNCINCNFSKSSKELIKFWFANYFSIWLELAANHLWKRKVNLSLTFANWDFSVKKLILYIISSWLFFFIFQCF